MKLRSSVFALVLLLGVAYAKDKQKSDYPIAVTVETAVYDGSVSLNPGSEGCFMRITDGTHHYVISSNGFCHTFNPGTILNARLFDSSLVGRMVELAWMHDGKIKTAKYRINQAW